AWGVEPDAVVGHSMGEVAAACVAGALSLEDAARVICVRSRLLRKVSGKGAMAVVELTLEQAQQRVKGHEGRVSVAVSNSASSTVLSGEVEGLEELVKGLEAEGVFCRRVKVDVASHSPQMDVLRQELLEALQEVKPRAGRVPVLSTVSVEQVDGSGFDAGYWVKNLREPVMFGPAVEKLKQTGHTLFVELSPHPILVPAIEPTLRGEGGDQRGVVVGSLRREQPERERMLESLGRLYAAGLAVDWRKLYPTGHFVAVPTYRWNHKRYWLEQAETSGEELGPSGHALHGQRVKSPSRDLQFVSGVGAVRQRYLDDHRVFGEVVVPGAFHVAAMLSASAEAFGPRGVTLEGVEISGSLPLAENETVRLHLLMTPEEGEEEYTVSSSSLAGEGEEWRRHAGGRLRLSSEQVPGTTLEQARARCSEEVSPGAVYGELQRREIDLRTNFQSLGRLWRGPSEAVSELRLADGLKAEGMPLHPVELDACAQTLLAAMGAREPDKTFVPFAMERLRFHGRAAGPVWCHAVVREVTEETCIGDVRLYTAQGEVVAEVEGLVLKQARRESMLSGRVEEEAWKEWVHEVAWRPQEREGKGPAGGAGRWVVYGQQGAWLERVAGALEERGQQVVRVEEAAKYERQGEGRYGVNWKRAEDFAAVVGECVGGEGVKGVLLLVPREDGAAEVEETVRGYTGALHWVQALAGAGLREVPRLWLVTRGAQALEEETVEVRPAQAAVWGLGRTVVYEHPELVCTRVDLSGEEKAAELVAEVLAGGTEEEVLLKGSLRYVGRLRRRPVSTIESVPVVEEGTYLLTGGLGGLGLAAAKWLVSRGAKNLVLVGRQGAATEEQRQSVEELKQQGARVVVGRADVASAAQLERVLQQARAEGLPSLKGVVHAAGVLEDGLLLNQGVESLRRVLAPKVEGALNLEALTASQPLDFFVLYSSVVAVLGSPGQANYAAANAFLDAQARRLRSKGQRALSINWGTFAEVGLAAAQENRGARLEVRGIRSFKPQEGVELLEKALGLRTSQVALVDLDARQWFEFYPQVAGSRRLSSLLSSSSSRKVQGKKSAVREKLRAATPAERPALVRQFVREQMAWVLRLEAASIDPHAPLRGLGMDSLMGLELRNRLEAGLGLRFPATLVWTYPTLDTLAENLSAKFEATLEGDRAAAPQSLVQARPVAEAARPSPASGKAEPIAIVGMGCRFPGGGSNPEAFWKALEQGVDAVKEIPSSRWPGGAQPQGQGAKWAALLDSVDGFDAAFFGISPREATGLDPQHRLLLEVTWEALEDAHQLPERLVGSRTGVFVGLMNPDYLVETLAQPLDRLDLYSTTGTGNAFAAGRISYLLGLQGPSLSVDTVCSSSLVAIHLACQSLRNGESEQAIAAGVNLLLSPRSMESVARLQALSPDGHCRTFDARANGFVRGEGCGVVVLKRLSDAVRDGDPIHAVIRGSAVNQDGRSTGLTAPNVLSQQALLRTALEAAGVPASSVDYIEAHGTGTSLGDPIEFEALKEVLGQPRADGARCVLGSVKTNLGHLESAAGIAGLIKVVQALKHERIPRHLHFQALNPRMSLEGTPFVIPTQELEWKAGSRRRVAGVSSFGLSGTNAHVVLEEAPQREEEGVAEAEAGGPYLLPVSARSAEALKALAESYAGWVEGGTAQQLRDGCYTAGVGRGQHEHRLAVVGSSGEEVAERLRAWAKGESRPNSAWGVGGAQGAGSKVV
ncbi:SDR family NAD(P)-dependent oxidoreductase, partial [Hyalangium sp.]|uniref:SDR family NAD(P)-dependent oxidoreductase n=1 Tax=Hyalangium sp. TaxID=2028555 RepID=UPI002D56A386